MTGGEWIGSFDVEELVGGVVGVAEVAVIGVPNVRWGERLIAVLVAALSGYPTLKALNRPILSAIEQEEIGRYARPGAIEIVDTLTRTSVGKADKKLLSAHFGSAISHTLALVLPPGQG
jgi:fatty-acyl-CoA synthase